MVCELSDSELTKTAKCALPPQFCTRDVDRRFCGGGAWISRSDGIREGATHMRGAFLEWNDEYFAGPKKTMTATDVTGFDAIFSTGCFATFSRF